jgi:UDP-N-acetylglucosamine--N-acetylmuramyl-(pentapeptide) pyrophosphoryl-undecaprenol N-acetylglucosamine transferase
MSDRAVFIAGGGTGGHVVPSLAVASALRDLDAGLAVEFIGTAKGLESRLVPEAGWQLHTVAAVPLARRLSPALLRVPGVLLGATRQVRDLLRRRHAVAAVVFGGYVSVPLALAARRARIPLVVHEQNAVPGLANRLASRWAAAVAVTYPGQSFGKGTVEVTGNPVRPGLDPQQLAGHRDEGLELFGLEPDRRTLLVFGGSQGARRINTAVVESATRWSHPQRLQILHAAGRRDAAAVSADWERLRADTPAQAMPLVRCVEFIDRMELAYAVADAVVCRAGASTLAELTVLGLPSVLVPYPHATADHQTANARALQAAGGALCVPDSELDAARLVAEAEPLLLDDERRHRMAEAARTFGRPDAARRVAQLVLGVMTGQPDAATGGAR